MHRNFNVMCVFYKKMSFIYFLKTHITKKPIHSSLLSEFKKSIKKNAIGIS